jgi:endonuclease/exonuclease/phosphatase family metal-dependent hydrolase
VAWQTFVDEGFQDAWLAAKERIGPPVTWSAFGPPADEDRRIDWILTKGDAEVEACETVLYHEDGRYPSDHYAVRATLRLR